MKRTTLAALVLTLTLLAPKPAHADRWDYTADDTLQALEDLEASPTIRCIVYIEVGRGSPGFAPWDPNQIGGAGELGPAQLHPRGMLTDFLLWSSTRYYNGSDPFSPWQTIAYLQHREEMGRRALTPWAGIRDNLCT